MLQYHSDNFLSFSPHSNLARVDLSLANQRNFDSLSMEGGHLKLVVPSASWDLIKSHASLVPQNLLV